MTREEIKLKSKQQLEELVWQFYSSPYIGIYFAMKKQIDSLSEQIEEANIKFDGSDSKFDAFLKFGDKFDKISQSLEAIQVKIDKDILIQEKEKRLSSRAGTVESFVKNK